MVAMLFSMGCGSDSAPQDPKAIQSVWTMYSDPQNSNYLIEIDLSTSGTAIVSATGVDCTCSAALTGTTVGTLTLSSCALSAGSGSCAGYDDAHDYTWDGATLKVTKINGLEIYLR